jgi:hypothetical protein
MPTPVSCVVRSVRTWRTACQAPVVAASVYQPPQQPGPCGCRERRVGWGVSGQARVPVSRKLVIRQAFGSCFPPYSLHCQVCTPTGSWVTASTTSGRHPPSGCLQRRVCKLLRPPPRSSPSELAGRWGEATGPGVWRLAGGRIRVSSAELPCCCWCVWLIGWVEDVGRGAGCTRCIQQLMRVWGSHCAAGLMGPVCGLEPVCGCCQDG